MKIHASLPLLGASLLVLGLATAHAETAPTRPTEAQMKAVHDCTAAKGVEMPARPAGGPPQDGGQGKGPHGPKLTDAQRAIVDACFAEQGLTPPKGHGPDGKGMGGKRLGGKPPEQKSPTETTK